MAPCSCEFNLTDVSLEGLRVGYAVDFWSAVGNETLAAYNATLEVSAPAFVICNSRHRASHWGALCWSHDQHCKDSNASG